MLSWLHCWWVSKNCAFAFAFIKLISTNINENIITTATNSSSPVETSQENQENGKFGINIFSSSLLALIINLNLNIFPYYVGRCVSVPIKSKINQNLSPTNEPRPFLVELIFIICLGKHMRTLSPLDKFRNAPIQNVGVGECIPSPLDDLCRGFGRATPSPDSVNVGGVEYFVSIPCTQH